MFFFAECARVDELFFTEAGRKFTYLFGGNQKPSRKDLPIYTERTLDDFDNFINEIIYAACDGRPSDIKVLESMTWYDFATVLNNYLKKVDQQKEQLSKFESEQKAKSVANKKRR